MHIYIQGRIKMTLPSTILGEEMLAPPESRVPTLQQLGSDIIPTRIPGPHGSTLPAGLRNLPAMANFVGSVSSQSSTFSRK